MPKSKLPDCRLGTEYIELIHIESAVGRPFHSAFGQDAYPSTLEKAIALFHSLIANHPFLNGNKRTAVIAFDLFLMANGCFLILDNPETYTLAQKTASYKQLGLTQDQILKEIKDATKERIMALDAIADAAESDPKIKEIHEAVLHSTRNIRRDRRNKILRKSN